MKKVLVVVGLLLTSSLLNSCGPKERIVGSDAAKLLVANERLDSTGLKNVNLSFDYSLKAKKSRNVASLKVESVKARRNNEVRVKRAREHETGVKVKREGNLITWTNFEEYSNAISYFDSFISSITSQAKEAASTIDNAKEKIESNNVWVKSLTDDMLLQVSENKDVVIRREDDYYQIVTRSLNEQGGEYYDLFNTNIGHVYGMRVRKMGNYRYEYSYSTEDGGFEHYFIADNSRGYWVVSSPINENSFGITVIKQDMVYDFTTFIDSKSIAGIRVITSDQKCDIANISDGNYSFYPGAFTNIASMNVEATDSEIGDLGNFDPNNEYGVYYDKDDKSYITSGIKSVNVNISNGKTLKEGDKFVNGKVEYVRGLISGNADGMLPEFHIHVEGSTLEERMSNLEAFINETGLQFARDHNEIYSSIKTAFKDATASLSSISWNDINLESLQSYQEARRVEKEKLKAYSSLYNEVKDNTVLSRNQQGTLDSKTKFPYIINSSFTASYEDNIVSIDNANVKVDDFTLFDNNAEYNMQFAFAQYDEANEGYFNLLPLEVENPNYVTYNGQDQLTVSTNNLSFALPVPTEGTYELVTYVANKEGIRVTRPQPVKFQSVESRNISIHNYIALVSKTDEGFLGITSSINDNVILEIKNQKEYYNHSELYRLLSTEAYNYGIPNSDNIEVINSSSTWEIVNSSSSNLSTGTYRLSFLNQDNKQVYVYTTIR